MSKLLKKLICFLFVGLWSVSLASCTIVFVPDYSPENPEQPKHEHIVCPECGKCTATDCDGTVEDKCAGHEDVEKPSIKDNYECITIAEAIELAMCNWNSKSYYTGCVISVTKDGVKTNNTLNFTNK